MFSVDDGSQVVQLAAKDRNIIAATFTNFLLKNIGQQHLKLGSFNKHHDMKIAFTSEYCNVPVYLFLNNRKVHFDWSCDFIKTTVLFVHGNTPLRKF